MFETGETPESLLFLVAIGAAYSAELARESGDLIVELRAVIVLNAAERILKKENETNGQSAI